MVGTAGRVSDISAGAVFERIHAKLAALLRVSEQRTAQVRLPFSSTSITGTTVLTVWTPTPGFKFLLKGYDITVGVRTVLAASNLVSFGFWDNAVATAAIAPVCSFQATDPAGVHFQVTKDYGEGILSATADNALVLGPSATISTGVLDVMGVVWGDHVQD